MASQPACCATASSHTKLTQPHALAWPCMSTAPAVQPAAACMRGRTARAWARSAPFPAAQRRRSGPGAARPTTATGALRAAAAQPPLVACGACLNRRLRDDARRDPGVLAYIDAENTYAAAIMNETRPLQVRLPVQHGCPGCREGREKRGSSSACDTVGAGGGPAGLEQGDGLERSDEPLMVRHPNRSPSPPNS